MLITGEEASISKKQIHQRLLKKAGRLWGINEQELDSFDPLVNLLLEVFSHEYAKIGQEIASSNSRILEVLSEILVPDKVFTPMPAHGLALLNTIEPFSIIEQGDIFASTVEYVNPKNKLPEKKTFHFSPLDKFTLVKAEIAVVVFGDDLYKEKTNEGYHFFEKPSEGYITHINIGLSVGPEVENLKGTLFFLESEQENDLWDRIADLIKWTDSSGNSLNISKYYKDSIAGKSENYHKEFNDIVKEIRLLYEDKFFVVNSDVIISGKESEPDFGEELKLKLPKEKLFWIKLHFPYPQPAEIFENFDIHINAVPLINAKKEALIYKLNDFLNIVPIKSNSRLLSIERVHNEISDFALKNNYNAHDLKKGTYIIRHSGVKRFDKRNASEILDHLLDLIRDEIAAFSGLHDDHFTTILKQIKQLTAQLEDKISGRLEGGEDVPFLFVNPFKDGETLYINYWTTDGELGNRISRGSKIIAITNLSLTSGTNRFIIAPRGGKDRLNRDEKLFALKRSLISRNRVVTREDLKALSFEVLGTMLKAVEIKEGVGIDVRNGVGYTRTIQLFLTPNESFHQKEWDLLSLKLKKRIDNESFFVIPVEIKSLDPVV